MRFRADGYLEAFLEVADPDIEVRLCRNTFAETVEVVSEIIAQPRPSSTPLPPEEWCQVAGSVDNVFRTLDLLPGVAATDDFGSRLAVRGGTPDQTLTVMDGVEIHNPYRLFGIASAFNPETVESFQHQIGNKATREIPGSILYDSDSHLEAWDRRVAMGPMGAAISGSFRRLGDQRGMFADWTDRIATGEAPTQTPHPPRSTREARPRG